MSKKRIYTNKHAKHIIEYEGLDYAVQSYIPANAFKDKRTRKLWKKAGKALNNLEDYLGV